jgi:ribosome-binding factor A
VERVIGVLMKRDIEQKNQSYRKALGKVLLKVFPGESLIVTDVLLDPSMKHGKVWIKGSTEGIEQINKKKGDISQELKRYVNTRYMPSLEFVLDDRYLDHIDELFSEVIDEK